jgi:outer membrane usher protein
LNVNGTAREPIVALIKGIDIWMSVADLESVGLLPGRISPDLIRMLRGSPYVRLADTPALLTHTFDPADLTLTVDLKADAMRVNSIGFADAKPPAQPASSYTSSAYVNYALAGTDQGRPSLSLEATGSMRGHTLQGLFTRDSEGRSYRGAVSLSINDEPTKRQLILGDSLWTGTGLLGSVPIGGMTLQSFFGFEPGFISTPTLDVRGYAATPSTVDVLVNGTLVGQRQIPAGPFELGSILAQAGQNNVSAVVRDAFGRETTISGNSLYGSPVLLRPGLSTFSVSVGRLRQDRAGQGPAYAEPVLMAQVSLGVANSVTAGAGAQASRDLQAISGQLATTGDWGELATQLARSHSATGDGVALALSYRLSAPVWGLGAAFAKRQRNFAELSSPTLLADRVLQSGELSIGRRFFTVDWGLRLTATSNALSQSTRRLSLTATRRWNERLFTVLELTRSAGQFADTSLFLLASYALDASTTVSLAASRASGQSSRTLELSQSPQQARSMGYRLSNTWATDGSQRQFAQVSRDTRLGDFQLQASHAAGQSQYSWRAAGALALIDGVAAATTPIRDAFALVRVPSAPQVPVLVEGRFVGQTNDNGALLVPALGSYSRQRISIDTEALPLDYEVGEVERRVSPPLRGGEVVKFDVKVYRASTGRLLEPGGKPIASAVIVLGDGRRVSTGTVGDFVVEGDPPQGEAKVERPGQSANPCRVRFAVLPGRPATVQRLGELRCEP